MLYNNKHLRTNILAISLCCFLGFLTQCKPDESIVYYDSFQIEKSLEGEKIDWIDASSGFDMKLYDSILVVVAEKSSHIFHIYNYKTHKKLAEIGTTGQGPGEFAGFPRLMDYYTETNDEIFCWIKDSNRRQFLQVLLLASIQSGRFIVNKVVKIAETGNAGICELLNDSIIADNSWRRENESLCVYKFGEQDMLWSVAKDKNLELRTSYGGSSSQILHVSPTNQKIITTFSYIPRIHIYSSSGILEKAIEEKNSPRITVPSGGPREFEQKNPLRFYGALLSEKYIIVIDENRIITEMSPSKILVFDYEGKAIARYTLNRVIRGYAMDWEHYCLIAFDPDNYEFVKYDLSEALKK
jgi:hypothetical protein